VPLIPFRDFDEKKHPRLTKGMHGAGRFRKKTEVGVPHHTPWRDAEVHRTVSLLSRNFRDPNVDLPPEPVKSSSRLDDGGKNMIENRIRQLKSLAPKIVDKHFLRITSREDTRDWDPSRVLHAYDAMAETIRSFPQIGDVLTHLGTERDAIRFAGGDREAFDDSKGTLGVCVAGVVDMKAGAQAEVYIHSGLFTPRDNPRNKDSSIEKSVAKGWLAQEDYSDTLIHEFGHAFRAATKKITFEYLRHNGLFPIVDDDDIRRADEFVKNDRSPPGKLLGDLQILNNACDQLSMWAQMGLAPTPSKYALSDPEEYWAESFTVAMRVIQGRLDEDYVTDTRLKLSELMIKFSRNYNEYLKTGRYKSLLDDEVKEEFEEKEHPRYKKGGPLGGRFRKKEETESAVRSDPPEGLWKMGAIHGSGTYTGKSYQDEAVEQLRDQAGRKHFVRAGQIGETARDYKLDRDGIKTTVLYEPSVSELYERANVTPITKKKLSAIMEEVVRLKHMFKEELSGLKEITFDFRPNFPSYKSKNPQRPWAFCRYDVVDRQKSSLFLSDKVLQKDLHGETKKAVKESAAKRDWLYVSKVSERLDDEMTTRLLVRHELAHSIDRYLRGSDIDPGFEEWTRGGTGDAWREVQYIRDKMAGLRSAYARKLVDRREGEDTSDIGPEPPNFDPTSEEIQKVVKGASFADLWRFAIEGFIASPSRYALTTIEEFWAESFTAALDDEVKPGEYPSVDAIRKRLEIDPKHYRDMRRLVTIF
jgi:hypothetical protein